jgi:catechol 2,3-dioxygenase-like lactoylglutathione lyase family enzyme
MTTAKKPQNPDKLFPLFISDKLAETKRYYTEKLGFAIAIDQPEYLQVRYGDGAAAPELCFMLPTAFPEGGRRPAFAGDGVIVSVPTADADSAHARMRKLDARIETEPTDKPWGWRSFLVRDPNGVVLDFFHVYKELGM